MKTFAYLRYWFILWGDCSIRETKSMAEVAVYDQKIKAEACSAAREVRPNKQLTIRI